MPAPPNPERLDGIARSVEVAFQQHNTDTTERLDVLAKHAGYAMFCSPPPDPEKAISEFARMVRANHQRFILAAHPPQGTG